MSRSIQMFAPIGRAWFNSIEGGVLNHETHRWAETHISSSGGGGYIHPEHGGAVASASVSSRVVSRESTQFWIVDKDNVHNPFTLSNSVLPVANGHIVKIVWGGKVGNPNGTILYARNQASGREMNYSTAQIWDWARAQGLANYPLIYRLVFYWLPFLMALYLPFVFGPVMNMMRFEQIGPTAAHMSLQDFSDIFKMHFDFLGWWTMEAAMKEVPKMGFKAWFAVAIIGLILHCIARAIGYMLLGWWMRPIIIYPLKMAVQELAETPATENAA